jgi:hypothetical protein
VKRFVDRGRTTLRTRAILRTRVLASVVVSSLTAMSLLAGAQTKRPAATVPAKKPPPKPASASPPKPISPDADDAGALAAKDERPPAAASRDAGASGGSVEARTLDGGTRVFRFGEVEVEGRLKSPQIVYFLRRVRAEFAAGDLGHRTFVRELSETRNEPGF